MSSPRFVSTRDAASSATFEEALLQGLAPDGGLYVPREWPRLDSVALPAQLGTGAAKGTTSVTGLVRLAELMLEPFMQGSTLGPMLSDIAAEAFSFDTPLVQLLPHGRLGVLELFHGPTAAFKDFGARFLAASLARLRANARHPLRILVATSGDTGGAVAAAFHRRAGIGVDVLFPQGLVSPTQQHQLTCWGDNVQAFAVRGTFDDCQRLVKEAFLDRALRERYDLSSANSINLGRLLPQAVYYGAASLEIWRAHGEAASFVVPSGNLGNALACVWARKLGFPIGEIVLAHNANRTVPDYLQSGQWRPRPSIATLASAMDVGNPSNMERLGALYPAASTLRAALSADSVDDAQIRARIRTGFADFGQVWCPHTATAAEVYARLPAGRREAARWVIVATAHPGKFREIIEPLIGRTVPVPTSLAQLFTRPSHFVEIDPDLAGLRGALA
jgi:threonine synthase